MKETIQKQVKESRYRLRWLAQWVLVTVLTGVFCGLIGTAFHLAVEHVTELRAQYPWILYLLPAAGLLIVAIYKLLRCVGVGTNNVISAVQSGEPLSILLVPSIFFGTVLTHLCGGSAGREGAALQMGGSIGWNISKLLHMDEHDCRTATMCGMAAFFSALFGTPMAATLFAIMVADVGLTFYVAFVPGLFSALIAYDISLAFGIAPTDFAVQLVPELSVYSALRVTVLALLCAVVVRLFCFVLEAMEHLMPKYLPNPWLRVVAGGIGVVVFTLLIGTRYNGAGMSVIAAAVEQGQALPWDFLCKIFLTALTLSVGFKGGEVVPSFFIGATFGCAVGPLLGLPAGFAASIGLVAVFCGATNTLVPSIVLAIELFGYSSGFELYALACGICYMFSGYHGLYSSQTILTSKMHSEYLGGWVERMKK